MRSTSTSNALRRAANARFNTTRRAGVRSIVGAAAIACGVSAATVMTPASASTSASTSVTATRRAPTPPTSHGAGCPTGAWSPTAQGRPAGLAPGSAAGVYLWHDSAGWHLRVTHPGDHRVKFTGSIDSSAALAGIERATESHDSVQFTHVNGKVKFTFQNYGRIDGIDFVVGCSNSFKVSAAINGHPIANNKVYIGSGSERPTSVPFRMERS